jgi:hypothetical protein
MADLREDARTLPRATFIARHPGLFLLAAPARADAIVGFQTTVLDQQAPGSAASSAEADDDVAVALALPIKKAPGNPYPDRISIGRARNCDLVLRHPSVSKLHAHFLDRGGGEPLALVDLGSRNGTLVDGRRLQPNTPAPLQPGSSVRFGRYTVHFVDAGRLYDLLAFDD